MRPEIGQNLSRVRIVKKESVDDREQEVYALVLLNTTDESIWGLSCRQQFHPNEGMKYKLGAAMTLCHVRVFYSESVN